MYNIDHEALMRGELQLQTLRNPMLLSHPSYDKQGPWITPNSYTNFDKKNFFRPHLMFEFFGNF